ncbi:MAG: 5'/3'-nucleotidase SurE [Lachnospiraceae bacterium]|nr:5'/3'-nucleotidase SurE [Lachnospiraceae bacterium]
MRKILITNDDGINADGLIRLAKSASKLGKVWVVAPHEQKSAASHTVTLRNHLDLYPVAFPVENVIAYSCSGMPVDCVRVGILNIIGEKPDVILSGINLGYNAASDIQYSATAGAAFEGVFQGIPSIALSEGFTEIHETTDRYLDELLSEYIDYDYIPGHIININFPGCKLSECKGILRNRTVSEGMFFKDTYDLKENLPNGGMRLMIHGTPTYSAEEGTDFKALLDNYVSVGYVNNIGYAIKR